jgi:hypothetical protein
MQIDICLDGDNHVNYLILVVILSVNNFNNRNKLLNKNANPQYDWHF